MIVREVPVETHTTTSCGEHGHREFTIRLSRSLPIPGAHRMLTGYLEGAVARGTQFLPGETIRFGWALLRVCERDDGTLGLEERELAPELSWTESVERALRDVWYQREVVDSMGLIDSIAFPSQDQGVLVADCAADALDLVMVRVADEELPDDLSGWTLTCAEDHDHGEYRVLPLLAVAATKPGLVQLLALPHGLAVLVLYRQKADMPAGQLRIEPHVFREGDEIAPEPGSYLDALQRA